MKNLMITVSVFCIIHILHSSAVATPPAPLPQTGQTSCWDATGSPISCVGTGQDGERQSGIPWPNPRFTNNYNGTITDNLTGLVWLKNADCFGKKAWPGAMLLAHSLTSGQCGLIDGSTVGEWRLPSRNELESLLNASTYPDTWLMTQGFTTVQAESYFSGSTVASSPGSAWIVGFGFGTTSGYGVAVGGKGNSYSFWPVRVEQ
jgi:hypothetical protein